MGDSLPNPEIQKVRSARNAFFSQLLKRAHPQPQSVRYEDTTAPLDPLDSLILSNKRLKSLESPSESFVMAASNPFSKGPKQTPLIIRFYDPEVKAKDAHGRTLEDILAWSDVHLERSHDYIQTVFPLPEGSMFSYSAPIINREVMEAFHLRSELRHRLSLALTRMLNFYGFEVSTEPEGEDEEMEQSEAAAEDEDKEAENVDNKEKAKEEGTATDEVDAKEADPTVQQETSDKTTATEPSDLPNEGISQPPPQPLMGYYVVRGNNWQQASRNWAVRMDHNHLRITRILRCLRVLGLQKECEAFYTALKQTFNDLSITISERSMMYWRRAVRQPLHIAPDGERVPWIRKWEEEQEQEQEQV